MKLKTLNFLLIVTSFFGYLEWGEKQSAFLFSAELEIISKLFSDPNSVIHPFILIPLTGQIILLITLLQKEPGRYLTTAGIVCLGLLLSFIFIIGCMSLNVKIILSTTPFMFIAIWTLVYLRGSRKYVPKKNHKEL